MRTVLSPGQMRALEARYFEAGRVSSEELMERAARALAEQIGLILGGYEGHTAAFACGPGGNGGDGYAAARLFAGLGGRAVVVSVADEAKLAGDARRNCLRAHETPRCFFQASDELGALPRPELWVDAMLGIGLNKPMEGRFCALARRMADDRARGSFVLAVDIASGLNGHTGRCMGEAVRADRTVTFEHRKLGHLLNDGPEQGGELVVRSIGIPPGLLDGGEALEIEPADLRAHLHPRRRNTHKGSYGHLLIAAGSRGMAGAAVLTAMAALRSGAGLVTVACPESLMPILQVRVPCAMCAPLPESDGVLAPEAVPILEASLRGKSAVAVGPGLGANAPEGIVRAVLGSGLPAVLDADALNIIANHRQLTGMLHGHHIITPHPGEAARLLNGSADSPYDAANALRSLGCRALLKGATTLIAGERITLSTSGTPGMAKGGSGDVLTGVIGALLAQGYDAERAGYIGSELHGLAGEAAARRFGEVCMTAEDLVSSLKEAFELVQ